MSDYSDPNRIVNHTGCDFLWGAAEIAKAINRTPRQTHYLLKNGQIQCAQKKGGRWVALALHCSASWALDSWPHGGLRLSLPLRR